VTEQRLVSAAIRIIGLWRIFYLGMSPLYYVIAKHLSVTTTSNVPITTDWYSLIFEVLTGTVLVFGAPFIAEAIFGTKSPQP
jgi:hypothetical protein